MRCENQSSCVIPDRFEHLLRVRNPGLLLRLHLEGPERKHLPASNLVAIEHDLCLEVCLHVSDEGFGRLGRDFNRFGHVKPDGAARDLASHAAP
jgi:hypothetical protein